MTSSNSDRPDAEKLNRRRLLQGLAATGTATTAAGCLGPFDSDDEPSEDEPTDDETLVEDDETEPADPEDVQEGGRLEFAVERPAVDNYDMADSTLADDTMIFNAVYDGLYRLSPGGELYNWMAEKYEITDAQDVDWPGDYVEYMAEYEIVNDDGSQPVVDTEWPNTVIPGVPSGFHPDDIEAYRAGELAEGDTIRALTREEAGDAVADGVYGTRLEGRLRDGIEFHNGEQCTAGDLVGSYDRFVGSDNEGQQFTSFFHAEALQEDGLEFVLYGKEADAAADTGLDPISVFPREHHDIRPGELDPREDGPVPVGTGPYELAEFEEGTQLLLERTDSYWVENVGLDSFDWFDDEDEFPERPAIEEINIRFVPEDGTRVASLQSGEADVAYELPAGDRTVFDQQDEFDVQAAIATGFNFMQFPIADNSVFQHREVREAVSRLIPRNDIVEIVEEGWAAPAQAPIPEPAAGPATHLSYDEFETQEWSYPADPDVEAAEELIEESPVEPPIEMIVRTNADDPVRQDKMQITVDELNASGLFEATLETPADLGDWTSQELYTDEATEEYGADNAVAVLGLTGGFEPDGYHRVTHHPANFNGCCNFFHEEGTFDWVPEAYDATRYGTEVAADPDLRRDRFDELWPEIMTDLGNTLIDYDLTTVVAGPRVNGYAGYPDRREFLNYCLYDPFDGVVAWLGDE